jgi:hypothetical protein
MRRFLWPAVAVAVATLTLAACGGSTEAPGRASAVLALRLPARSWAVPAPVGDVDGDGLGDVVLAQGEGEHAWLLTSRGRDTLVALRHARLTGGFGQSGHAATELGDVDGDGFSDLALANDRFGLAIVYGARSAAATIDLRAAGRRVGLISGSAAGRAADAVARQGPDLLAAVDCGVGCLEDRTVRVRIPPACRVTALSGAPFPRPVATPPVRLSAPVAPWASGSSPLVVWRTTKPAPARRDTPLVAAPGARGRLLGPDDVPLGMTRAAALVATQPDVPSGAAVRSQLKLYRLSGRPRMRALTREADFDVDGTMIAAGRCLLVSGWGNTPTAVWAVDARSLSVVSSWTQPDAASVAASPAGQRISIVAVSPAGRLSRAVVALPSGCR